MNEMHGNIMEHKDVRGDDTSSSKWKVTMQQKLK